MLLTAATIPSNMNSFRDELIGFVYQSVYAVLSTFPLPMIEDASTGNAIYGIAGRQVSLTTLTS
jgi:hypothetical protein